MRDDQAWLLFLSLYVHAAGTSSHCAGLVDRHALTKKICLQVSSGGFSQSVAQNLLIPTALILPKEMFIYGLVCRQPSGDFAGNSSVLEDINKKNSFGKTTHSEFL